jgi:hypothetical protein
MDREARRPSQRKEAPMQFIKNLLVNLIILVALVIALKYLMPDFYTLINRSYGALVAAFALVIVVITAIPRKKW